MRREVSRNRLPIIVSLLSAAVALLAPAAAFGAKAQVCVDPDKSKCLPTIQEGIDAAEAGQTIEIAKGEYFENLLITKVALQLEGAGEGKTIVRGNPGTPVVTIDNKSVMIKDMTFRGGNASGGILITADSSGVILDKIEVKDVAAGAGCVTSNAVQTIIRNSTIGSCAGACVAFGVNLKLKQGEVVKSEIGPCGGPAIRAGTFSGSHDQLFIDKNTIFGAGGGHCVYASGNDVTLTRNEIHDCGCSNLYPNPPDTGVNRLCPAHAVRLLPNPDTNDNSGALIDKNEFSNTEGSAVVVECGAGCSDGSISKNDVENTGGGGIEVLGGGDGSQTFVIEKNSVENVATSAFLLAGGDLVARKNSAKESGTSADHNCYQIDGDNNLLEDNTADRCTGDGFRVAGSGNNLNKNTANRNIRNGFRVDNGGVDNVLSESSAKKNEIYGYEINGLPDNGVGAENTVLNEGKGSGNLRADLCNAGVNTTINGGKYKTIDEDRNDGFFDSCFNW